jgi:ribosome biogenesis protein ERB1
MHEDVTLTNEELEIIQKLQANAFPEGDPFAPSIDFFTQDVMVNPINNAPEPKRRFIPSKWEHKTVMKIVRAIRAGLIVPNKPKSKKQPQVYGLWNDQVDQERVPHVMHIAAPKMRLPVHSESYNPPQEYIPTPAERAHWEALDAEDRRRNYLPQKYPNLRSVPAYSRFINERFGRCLDLYLCPRALKPRAMDPEDLMPKLPDPSDLEPYPKQLALTYQGHTGRVRCFSVDPTGQWLASGSDDKTVRLWEVATGRLMRTWTMASVVLSIAWNPAKSVNLFAVAVYVVCFCLLMVGARN